MPGEGRAREQIYRAFISYSHRDDAIARTLHKRLETYPLPKYLIDTQTARGPVPKQLTPIFRDLDELSAADDLSAEIKAALARSEVLIILASPAAKASKWVNLEIETFRALHGNARPVLVALIEGEPVDAFPPALTANGHEPVAADFRKSAPGGKRLALLKLVAGITAAPLDALVQRDAQRQYRRVTAITGSALAAVLVMALLLVVALRSQAEAERQRQEAEGLVEYMLTDLRDRLKGVTTLNVMTSVNERAMKYYGGQKALDGLPAESLERRARILHAMGEDDQKRGQFKLALRKFLEAHRTTAALLSQKPDDPDRIFSHAQSEYWIGNGAQKADEIKQAMLQYRRYQELSIQLEKYEPNKFRSLMERGYAENNIGILLINNLNKPREAINYFKKSHLFFNNALIAFPGNSKAQFQIADALAWRADCHLAIGDRQAARVLRLKELDIKIRLLSEDPNNVAIKRWLVGSYRALAAIDFDQIEISRIHLIKAKKISSQLVIADNSNFEWKLLNNKVNQDLEKLENLKLENGEGL